MILEGWTTCKLGDFIEINPTVTLQRGEKYSFVEMKDLDSSKKYTLPSMLREYGGGSKFQNRDTLFARITPCLENGKICMVKELKNNHGFGSTEFIVLRGKEKVSDNDFVFYLSRTRNLRNAAIQNMTGTSGRQRVEKTGFENIEVLAPINLTEQFRIASILSSFDDKIELNLQMNKTLEAIAQAVFKEWFVDFRFPGFDGELTDGLPKGWMIKKISEICEVTDFVANGSFASLAENVKYQTEPDYAILIRLTDYNRGFNENYVYINESGYKFLKKSKLSGDEIIIANVGANAGDVFRVPRLNRPMTLGPNAIMIKDNCFSNYLYLFCISDIGQHIIKGIISGSAQPKFNKTDFRKIGLIVPNEVTIKRFNEIYSSLYDKILFNNNQNRCLTKIRNSLLPKLMTGKIKVG